MLLDERTVSRKTPLDGRLEISEPAADRLAALGDEFVLVSAGHSGRGRVTRLACTCAKANAGGHVHHFLESSILMALDPGADVCVELDERASEVRVELAERAR
jgi:hypothetical protein